jgi:glycosyltransferase involved in cell wall biosynthesis
VEDEFECAVARIRGLGITNSHELRAHAPELGHNLRVLHVYSGNLYGGIETMLVTLARHRELCPEMEPHFALCFEGRLSEELTASGVPIHMLGNVRVSRPSTVRRARRALSNLFEKVDFDCVVCHAPWSQGIFGRCVKAANLSHVFWLHDAVGGRHWLERWASRTPPALVICNSRFTASTLSNLFPDVRAEVLYCPVAFSEVDLSEDDRRATRAELETPDDATVIIQVSRMEAWKGQALHLEALAELRDVPGWVCWLVGGAQRPHEAAYKNELETMVTRLGIQDRVRFFGERTDVPKLLYDADIFCQPNATPEPFGIAFIEALYAGLPIVATALGGALEIVEDSCGMLVDPNDKFGLAAALHELISDPARRASLGSNGPARARELCDPAAQMDSLYSKLMSVSHVEMVG